MAILGDENRNLGDEITNLSYENWKMGDENRNFGHENRHEKNTGSRCATKLKFGTEMEES